MKTSPVREGEEDFWTHQLLGSILLTSLHSLTFIRKTNIHLSSFDAILQRRSSLFFDSNVVLFDPCTHLSFINSWCTSIFFQPNATLFIFLLIQFCITIPWCSLFCQSNVVLLATTCFLTRGKIYLGWSYYVIVVNILNVAVSYS